MERPPGNNDPPVTVHVRVHHVDGEQGPIFVDRGSQKLGYAAIESQRKAGEISCSAMVDTLLTEADAFDVAQAVEDGECLAILQHAGAVICQRGRGQDVVLILYLDDIFQRYGTSPGSKTCTSSSA